MKEDYNMSMEEIEAIIGIAKNNYNKLKEKSQKRFEFISTVMNYLTDHNMMNDALEHLFDTFVMKEVCSC